MNKKAMKAFFLAIGMSVTLSLTAYAEYTCTYPGGPSGSNKQAVKGTWTQDENGTRFTAEDGQVYADHWLYYKNKDYPSKGVWCYFDSSGYMLRNQFLDFEGKKYFLGDDGIVKKNWFVYNGNLYNGGLNGELYTSASGKKSSKNGKQYTFDSEGRAISLDGEYDAETKKLISEEQQRNTGTGWKEEGDAWTYWRDGQKLVNEWVEQDGKWFYLDENGNMVARDVKNINGTLYAFDISGAMRTSGGANYGGKKYDIMADGSLQDKGVDQVMTDRHVYVNRTCNLYTDNATVQWINATYAIFTHSYGGNIKAFSGIVLYDDMMKMAAYTIRGEELANSWGVTDRSSADGVLNRLIESGNVTGSAWDYSRAISNLGFYYQVGYYTQEEALDKALEIAKIIQTRFDSWDSYNQSYLAGYNAWRGDSGAPREPYLEELKASQHNPFAIDWNLELEKSW